MTLGENVTAISSPKSIEKEKNLSLMAGENLSTFD